VFEFTIAESPADIDEIEVLWEGYADDCAQMELYVWDYMENQWSDGKGNFGVNAYMDNFAGNADEVLTGALRHDLARFIDAEGQVALLVYVERSRDRTFMDYMSLTVKRKRSH